MSELQSRLDSIQDHILELFERQSTDLKDHEQYWLLIRREQAILFLARQKHVRLSMPVPSQAASKSRARDAIEMSLLIKGLSESQYGTEEWTLQQVSRERLLAPPEYTFKKGGRPITVMFDDMPDNTAEYTAWDLIYYQDADNQWQKAKGDVDMEGLFYKDSEGDKVYYVDFSREATKYGRTGKWSLLYNNNALASVDSPGYRDSDTESSPDSSPVPARSSRNSKSRSPAKDTRRRPRLWLRSKSRSRSRSRSSSRSSGRSRSRSPFRRGASTVLTERTRRSPGSHLQSPGSPVSSTSAGRRGSAGPRRLGSSSRPRELAPDQVGSSRQTVSSRPRSSLERLLEEARDPPGLLLTGPPNTLKCYRYSLKNKHSSLFTLISTTFHWTESKGPKRIGDGKMVIMFDDEAAREWFLKTVSLPRTLAAVKVDFGGL
ncbi:putative early E2 protein [Eptesicus serotinus papillomavirus 1]|uniref:Regulatory protein E2 n=1 Tax=Eptesicus serotinus papillomavirus 1 TaxID=1464071 RepID=W8E8L3_9PAPI|nr:putative early E2 protein [Eptesicus serotinus papillomavirus 1]AHJ81387.1 putative early E2 protein [Eptesicus serotinus papillomavirus 1]